MVPTKDHRLEALLLSNMIQLTKMVTLNEADLWIATALLVVMDILVAICPKLLDAMGTHLEEMGVICPHHERTP